MTPDPNSRVRKRIEFLNTNKELKSRGIVIGQKRNAPPQVEQDVELDSPPLDSRDNSQTESLLDI